MLAFLGTVLLLSFVLRRNRSEDGEPTASGDSPAPVDLSARSDSEKPAETRAKAARDSLEMGHAAGHSPPPRLGRRRVLSLAAGGAFVLLLVAGGVLGVAAAMGTGGSSSTAGGARAESGAAQPSPTAAQPTPAETGEAAERARTSPAVVLSRTSVAWGKKILVRGDVAGASAGDEVVLELGRDGRWQELGRAATDGAGGFVLPVVAPESGLIRARLSETGSASEPVAVSVVPKVRVRAKDSVTFGEAKVVAQVQPRSYAGPVAVTVEHDGRIVRELVAPVRLGRLELRVPTPAVGQFDIALEFAPEAGVAGRTVVAQVEARAPELELDAKGPAVRALAERLAELRFHVPEASSQFGTELEDAVIAFQKSAGLDRTGVVTREVWQALSVAQAPIPRHRKAGEHIEIDKTRQLLLVVDGGQVSGVLPVSTGVNGNTPEGAFDILWKAPTTTTWYGPGLLYRTLTFHGNFAIHGYPSVPVHPASHGCVRVPMWAADWLYDRSPVGEPVYVYSS